jgi:hypothetical protein
MTTQDPGRSNRLGPEAPGGGGRQGRQSVNSELFDHNRLKDMARKWYGYGRWGAPYWFIGPEPGMDKGEHGLEPRCEAWLKLDGGELVDCREHHQEFNCRDYHREFPPAAVNPTWKQLIRLFLAYSTRKAPQFEDIRSYQRTSWGAKDGDTCVIELCPLAAHKLGDKKAIDFDAEALLRDRIKTIRERILENEPAFVVMYRMKHKSYWEEIAGTSFSSIPDICTVGNSRTLAVFANHPVDKFGVNPAYWLELAEKLRSAAR